MTSAIIKQLLAIARAIRNEPSEIGNRFSSPGDAVNKHAESVSQQSERQNEQQEKKPPGIVVLSELHIPEDEKRETRAQNERKYRQQTWLTVGTWAAFLAAAVYAGLASCQLREMRKATEATERAAKAAESSGQTADATLKTNLQIIKGTNAAVLFVGWFNVVAKGVSLGFTNSGKLICPKVQGRIEISRRSLPDNKQIGQTRTFSVASFQIRPADTVNLTYDIPELTREDLNSIQQTKETIIIKGDFSYDNGFGEMIPLSFCVGNLALHFPSGASSGGWPSCDEIPRQLRSTLPPEKQWEKNP